MKFLTDRKSALFIMILGCSIILCFNYSLRGKIKKNQSILPSKNESSYNMTSNNENNNTQIIQDFPLKIEIIWNSFKDNLNLHLKRIDKGRNIKEHINFGSYRINNETLIKSQTMMLEKLVSGIYVLYAEKFDSLKILNVSNATVSIFSDKKSYFNITCDKNYSNVLNWGKPVFWEIGKFEFFSNSVVFETLNFLTNEINEGIQKYVDEIKK